MIYDPKSPSNLLPPFMRFMCRLLGLLSLLGWIAAGLGMVVLAGVAVFLAFTQQPVSLIIVLLVIPLGGMVFGLRNADRLFTALRRGDYFAVSTAKSLRNFAIGMVVYFLTPIPIALLLALTGAAELKGPPNVELHCCKLGGQPGDPNTMLVVIFLGAIILFASIWGRAVTLAEESRRLANENAQFV